ncbi:hypothetical protein AZE42_13030, partial [Rhizopogon vesiculosus]
MRQRFEEYIFGLQEEIITSFERLDPNAPSFKRDSWEQTKYEKGISGILSVPPPGDASPAPQTVLEVPTQRAKGISGIFSVPPPGDASPAPQTVLEKAGVNLTVVHGILPPPIIKEMREDHPSILYDAGTSLPFFAAVLDL